MRQAQFLITAPLRLRRHARPRPLHGARTGRSPTGRSSCRWAGSTRRGRPRKRRSSWPPTTSSSWPTGWSRPASTFIDLDTAGAAGDADFLAALKAIERIRARYPDLGIQIGMASEFVLGMHGELEYDGVRLAGLWPRDQMKLAAKAGVTIFGPAINVNTGKSVAWNVARTLHHRQAVLRRGDGARAPQRRHGRRRRADARPAAGRRHLARLARCRRHPASSTACRWAPATSTARRSAMASPRGWAGSGPLEIWWPGCRSPGGCGFHRRRSTWRTSSACRLLDLSDPVVMLDVRKERGLGAALESGEITGVDEPIGLEAKFHIAALLDVPVNSVERFRRITAPRG